MSVLILGGNDCMTRQYKNICKSYGCKGKVFTHMEKGLRHRIGNPDIIVLFTSTATHQQADSANLSICGKLRRCGCSLLSYQIHYSAASNRAIRK